MARTDPYDIHRQDYEYFANRPQYADRWRDGHWVPSPEQNRNVGYGNNAAQRARLGNATFQPVPFNTLVDSPVIAGKYFRELDLTPGGSSVHRYLDMVGDDLAALDISDAQVAGYRHLVEQEEAREREAVGERLARGEQALGLSSTTNAVTSVGEPLGPDTGGLRIGDADRHLIAEVLSQHMVDGRLTTDELEDRLGTLYASRTRAQARSALASLPTLARSGGDDHAALVLPDWASAAEAGGARSPGSMPPRPSGGGVAPVPTDGEMNTAYRRWRAKAEKTKAAQAAHQQAEASGDPRESALAFKLKVSRGEEKTARAKLDQLRTRRPDWTAGDR